MAVSVTLPALGESVTEGTVTRWLKEVGEMVQADEPLLEVSTDKVDTEIPAPASGVLVSIMAAEDETVEIGATLAVIGAPDSVPAQEALPGAVPSAPQAPVPEPVAAPAAVLPAPAAPGATPGPAPVGTSVSPSPSPVAPVAVAPMAAPQSGPAVPPAAAPAASHPAQPPVLRGQTVAMTRVRKIIGDSLKKALLEQAQLTTVVEVDVTELMRLRERAREDFVAREGIKLSPMPFFIHAAVQALKSCPVINARINEGEGTITYFDEENVGIAVDTERGLMTPVIKGAGELSIAGIARRTLELAGKARQGGLAPDEVSGATFTISNTGSRGALFDTVIVPPGQAAILGVGAAVKRPAVVEIGEDTVVGVRDIVHLTLSYDHRLVDGADAARYLVAVKATLESAAFAGELSLVAGS
ncbi:2-oxo acid dehydrogenase subunit E2 [Streptomyces sp. ADI93-02]|uniref:2-oxo acid dehydrogenase subunit E2 n=1 Tax=Streptomyces sp. ADI93-02 TaxID=1522757 RepID=UPI000F54ED53|nr:2-oxo acid dehydrogenase subunit E2 [Streptomyces sp. ADI93-02]RPK32230.1 Dihydrolipoyllysine-residue acetyltransferase component of pyruvate dehydrogenase complex [Streptomyces sp. ADI93-02]